MQEVTPVDLPEDLTLPLPSGAPWWYWIAGRPSLDFVNTRRERWRRRVETLVTPEDLVGWLRAAGLLGAAHPGGRPLHAGRSERDVTPTGPALLAEARELREAIDAGVLAATGEAPAEPADIAVIDAWLDHAPGRPRLQVHGGLPVLAERAPDDPVRAALGALALDAAQLLGRPEEAVRVRICASETCSARFYDRSPAGRRRWCSMSACGNAAKARRHRERRRAVEGA